MWSIVYNFLDNRAAVLRVFITNLHLLQDACNEAEQVSVMWAHVSYYPQAHMITILLWSSEDISELYSTWHLLGFLMDCKHCVEAGPLYWPLVCQLINLIILHNPQCRITCYDIWYLIPYSSFLRYLNSVNAWFSVISWFYSHKWSSLRAVTLIVFYSFGQFSRTWISWIYQTREIRGIWVPQKTNYTVIACNFVWIVVLG